MSKKKPAQKNYWVEARFEYTGLVFVMATDEADALGKARSGEWTDHDRTELVDWTVTHKAGVNE